VRRSEQYAPVVRGDKIDTLMMILCIASYEKGHEFLRESKRQGATVVLLTSLSLRDKAQWPVESIDEVFYMPDDNHHWDLPQTLNAVSYLARTRDFERIVPLDDFDVEVAAALREHLRVPGMGETTAHYFRDKLAMRLKARESGIAVPDFVHLLNHGRVRQFLESVPAPWVLKPRSMAGSMGIRKIHGADELWAMAESLGDRQSHYLLEQFVPGDIFHVDTIVYEKEVLFAIASGYGRPPMEVSHEGGIFTTRILERDSDDARRLRAANERVMAALGMVRGVSHTEFIKAKDGGRIYFLETSARVGGAHIADLVEAATGLNLWAEWAKVEVAGGKAPYRPPEPHQDYAGLLVSLARQPNPDTSAYSDPEIVWRMNRDHHAGLIVKSSRADRVRELLDSYARRFEQDFLAYVPPKEKPTS
jgi:phosphoribosylaminoimidazole carboxylase (NCAIR synthetase)